MPAKTVVHDRTQGKTNNKHKEAATSNTYLNWLANETNTTWWHDSADPRELQIGLERGATGVTTNPVLATTAIKANRELWADDINKVLMKNLPTAQKAEALLRIAVVKTAEKLVPMFKASDGKLGYVCGQVSPLLVGDREGMLAMAKRLNAWSPNICVKLPASSAGIDTIERCAAEGISTNATVSFTLAQLLAVGEQAHRGAIRAREQGITPAKSFATMMIGRLDDYLREVAQDNQAVVSESDIQQAGLAVVKRAYSIYKERGYETTLLVAALRGTNHLTELVGGDLVLSVHPSVQEKVLSKELSRECGIDKAIGDDVIQKLCGVREFVRAYEPDGVTPAEFITYGVTQRTISQFIELGWKGLESYK
jgi:transaldolase